MPSQAISTSPSAAGSAVPSGSAKCAVTRPPFCSTPVQRWPVMKFSAPIRSRTAPSSTRCRSGRSSADVRPLMAGRLAERLAIDELAVAGEEGVVLRLAGGRDQRVLEPERAQLLHRMRADIDADAERAHLGRGLEHADAAAPCPRRAAPARGSSPPIPPPMMIVSMTLLLEHARRLQKPPVRTSPQAYAWPEPQRSPHQINVKPSQKALGFGAPMRPHDRRQRSGT